MEIKKDRRYTPEHEWVKNNKDGTWTIGVTEYAELHFGDVDSVEFDVDIDDTIKSGNSFGTINGDKNSMSVSCAVSGTIIAINDELESSPEAINDSIWDDAWLIIVRAEDDNSHDTISAEEYRELISE
jgi:glycine cleavage system H protein